MFAGPRGNSRSRINPSVSSEIEDTAKKYTDSLLKVRISVPYYARILVPRSGSLKAGERAGDFLRKRFYPLSIRRVIPRLYPIRIIGHKRQCDSIETFVKVQAKSSYTT
jgi:hypothetical protein